MNSLAFMWLSCYKNVYSQTDGEDDQRSDNCRGIQLLEEFKGHVKMLLVSILLYSLRSFPFIPTPQSV
jgi:hypothetical protein